MSRSVFSRSSITPLSGVPRDAAYIQNAPDFDPRNFPKSFSTLSFDSGKSSRRKYGGSLTGGAAAEPTGPTRGGGDTVPFVGRHTSSCDSSVRRLRRAPRGSTGPSPSPEPTRDPTPAVPDAVFASDSSSESSDSSITSGLDASRAASPSTLPSPLPSALPLPFDAGRMANASSSPLSSSPSSSSPRSSLSTNGAYVPFDCVTLTRRTPGLFLRISSVNGSKRSAPMVVGVRQMGHLQCLQKSQRPSGFFGL